MLKNEVRQYLVGIDHHTLAKNDEEFLQLALRIFKVQARKNPTYATYLKLLGTDVDAVNSVYDIPFLPVSFFKGHEIKTGKWNEQTIFTSSTTSSQIPSKHFVRDLDWYHELVNLGITDLLPISRTTQHFNAHHFTCTTIVGSIQNCLHLYHGCFS